MKYTIPNNIALPLAVWCVNDSYDYDSRDNYISVTSLLSPVKKTMLTKLFPKETYDITDFCSARRGTAIHDSIEAAWKNNFKENLTKLGLDSNYEINPKVPNPELKQIYIEQRSQIEIDGWIIGGKFDFIVDGTLHDIKSTSVVSYTSGNKVKDYTLQCSIYRYLNRDKITNNDTFGINYVFTDWSLSKYKADTSGTYPATPILTVYYDYLSIEDTENYIRNKINLLNTYKDSKSEDELPDCPLEDLWVSDPVYKYYQTVLPNEEDYATRRSNKNFTSEEEALAYWKSKGKGIVIKVIGKPRKCLYCPAFDNCKQKDSYNLVK